MNLLDLLFLTSLILLLVLRVKIFYLFPIIGTLFDILRGYIIDNPVSYNYKFIFLVISIYIIIDKYIILRYKSIFIFSAYLLILLLLLPLSDYFKYSQITQTFNVISILFMFYVGYKSVNNITDLTKYGTSLKITLIIILIYFIIIQFVEIELVVPDNSYSKYFRADHFDYDIYTVVFIVLFLFFESSLFMGNKGKIFINKILIGLALVLLFFFMKRWAIYAVFIGIFYYLIRTKQKRLIYYLTLISIPIIIIFILGYGDILNQQYYARSSKFAFDYIKNEGRYLDYYFMGKYINDARITNIFFGGSLFETNIFGKQYLNMDRNIHPDILALFYGTGITGLLLYINILFEIKLIKKRIKPFTFFKAVLAFQNTIMIVLIFLLVGGGGLRVNTANSIAYFLLGGLKKIIDKNYEENFC